MIHETENQHWIFKAHIDIKKIMDNGNENKSALTETLIYTTQSAG